MAYLNEHFKEILKLLEVPQEAFMAILKLDDDK